MANAVFTTSESTAYDDKIEERYHFPSTYLNQVQSAVGDFILYYEPRRTTGPNSSTGRQAYFALARVVSVEPDHELPGHHYARVVDFIEFDQPIPFREGVHYYESMLRKSDGSTNKGAFGRSVRNLPTKEFLAIVQLGLSGGPEPWEPQQAQANLPGPGNWIGDEVPEYVSRPMIEQVVNRKFRDVAFRRHVRAAYDNTCAVTGLRLINGGGRPEVQAAHIRPVEMDGPDTVRNGIALTGTAHWLFDRGLLSFDDEYRILVSPHGVPDGLDKLIRKEGTLIVPADLSRRPHSTYLAWHREHRFKT